MDAFGGKNYMGVKGREIFQCSRSMVEHKSGPNKYMRFILKYVGLIQMCDPDLCSTVPLGAWKNSSSTVCQISTLVDTGNVILGHLPLHYYIETEKCLNLWLKVKNQVRRPTEIKDTLTPVLTSVQLKTIKKRNYCI